MHALVIGNMVLTQLMPIALNEQFTTLRTIGALAFDVVHISNIGVANASGASDVKCANQGFVRCSRLIE